MEKGSLKPGFLWLELVAVASTWQGFSLFIEHSFQGNLKKNYIILRLIIFHV